MSLAVATHSYDNTRSGANTQETVLTSDTVATRGIRLLFSLQMEGDRRGIEAQPLIVPRVSMADGSTHDVVYLASMANSVWAFDADNGARLWERTIGTPINGSAAIDAHLINDHWGILSTPVIDQDTGTMYLVAWVSPDGSVANAQHFLHAISIVDGHAVSPSLNLEGATYAPGHGLPVQRFRSVTRKQRASLLLTSIRGVKTVFVGFGSLVESSVESRGWVIACSTSPLKVTAAWASTAKGFGGGVWQAGAGLAANEGGFIYLMTGNGTFDAVTDFGESFVKLQYTPPTTRRGAGSLTVADWWTPFTDKGRVGVSQRRSATSPPLPTNLRVYTQNVADGWDDMDLGSGGPVVIPAFGLVVGAGKDGILYVVNQANMGKTKPADLENPRVNYAMLESPPIFFTYFPGYELSPAPQDISTLNLLWAGRTHHLHGNPVYWDSPDLGPMFFVWGENGNLRAWSMNKSGAVTYLACSAEQASAQAHVPPGGMPGGMLTLSADGSQPHSGVVWALIPYFDANTQVSPGRILAYDATQFAVYPDGSKQIRVLWDSQDWGIQFSFNKFNRPVVVNGKLYVPTYDDRVDVYGLA